MTDSKKTPSEWEKKHGIRVWDPDGWREASPYGFKPWDEPITEDEFKQRMYISTISGIGSLHDD
jgi:hypothetical protein